MTGIPSSVDSRTGARWILCGLGRCAFDGEAQLLRAGSGSGEWPGRHQERRAHPTDTGRSDSPREVSAIPRRFQALQRSRPQAPRPRTGRISAP
jgi:hypothetical protein